jgi:prevent-host-death family protein
VNVAIISAGVRELKDRLSHYLAVVRDGGEVLVTDHGRPVARMIPIEGKTGSERLAQLIAAGELTAAERLSRSAPRPIKLPGDATVSDLVKDQRR